MNIKRDSIITWQSCYNIWYGKVLLISGEYVEVEVLNKAGLRQWLKIKDIIEVVK